MTNVNDLVAFLFSNDPKWERMREAHFSYYKTYLSFNMICCVIAVLQFLKQISATLVA